MQPAVPVQTRRPSSATTATAFRPSGNVIMTTTVGTGQTNQQIAVSDFVPKNCVKLEAGLIENWSFGKLFFFLQTTAHVPGLSLHATTRSALLSRGCVMGMTTVEMAATKRAVSGARFRALKEENVRGRKWKI